MQKGKDPQCICFSLLFDLLIRSSVSLQWDALGWLRKMHILARPDERASTLACSERATPVEDPETPSGMWESKMF